jgi:hypothetical protein
MTQPDQFPLRALVGACALLAAVGAAHAQNLPEPVSTDANVPPATAAKQAREIANGEPSRWFREDNSMAARVRRLQKEIGAGLQEAQGACRKMAAAERGACMSEARATYQKEMAGVRARAMSEAH